MKKKKKVKFKYSKQLIYILLLISFILFIYSIINICLWYIDNKNNSKVINDINNIIEVPSNDENDSLNNIDIKEEEKTGDYWDYNKTNFIDVNISKLKSINNDTAGWIQVNNTNINYPFVLTNDNEYYLNHSFDKSKNNAGWLFMDYRNTVDLNNKNLIIYGHNRKDKTMFGTLKLLLTNNWFNKESNKIIKMSMESGNSNWEIFSVYITPNTNDYIKTNFINDLEYQEFLDLISNRNQVDIDTSVTINDKILTLSTCHGSTKKLVVHAKLISNN